MQLDDLVPPDMLDVAVRDGYVRRRPHPDEPLDIYNYTARAQYDDHWDAATRTCRGLVVHRETGRVVARPFPKFFALDALERLPEGRPRVFDKVDGSLGVVYREPRSGRWSVATRGSFDGEQARWATRRLRRHERLVALLRDDRTYLVEVVYPANRVVVDYGDREDLVLLDVLALDDGRSLLDEERARLDGLLPVVDELPVDVEQVRAVAVDPACTGHDAEGFVLRWDDGTRAKVKLADYVRLHAALFHLSTRTVHDAWRRGDVDGLLAALPDETHAWVRGHASAFDGAAVSLRQEADRLLAGALATAGVADLTQASGPRRGEVARALLIGGRRPEHALVFSLLSGRPLDDQVADLLRPSPPQPFARRGEDEA